jgi:membrane protease YdiL (CAAX protease family)
MSSPLCTPKDLLAPENRKPTVVLLLTPFLLTTFKYYGSKAFYLSHLTGMSGLFGDASRAAERYHFLSAFLLLGLIPALVTRFGFRESLRTCGVQWGDVSYSFKALLVMLPLAVLAAYPGAQSPEFMAEYPFDKGVGRSAGEFIGHAATYLLYYMGWEFFFRGFMQHGLRDRFGPWNAILVQTVASCLVHIGKPASEIYGSILAGLVWGFIVFRARSLWAVVLTHWALGVALDYFICFR